MLKQFKKLEKQLDHSLVNEMDMNIHIGQRTLIPFYLFILLENGSSATYKYIAKQITTLMPLLPNELYFGSEVSDGKSRIEKAQSFFKAQLNEMADELSVELIIFKGNQLHLTDAGITLAVGIKAKVEEVIRWQLLLSKRPTGKGGNTVILIKRKTNC